MKNSVFNRAGLAARLLPALACLALLMWGAAPLAAQGTGRITGAVTTDAGAPVADATVSVVGTQMTARTGPDGRFTIAGVPAGTHQVRAGQIGFASGTVSVTVADGQTAVANFRLATQTLMLEEVVAVGYTTQRRATVSDAVSEVSSEQIRDRQVATVEEALRGRVAGVNIASTGEPGRGSQVIIRGQNFLSAASPLYVVDGMYTRQNISLNPEDIESIQVLKDASAAAQYGAQSANGVIVITTKRGRAGPPRVSVNSYYGVQDTPRRIDFVNSQRWAEINFMARQNSVDPEDNAPLSAYDTSIDTDWQDAVFQSGAVQEHNFSVSGGTDNASYLVGAGYFDQKGTIIETDFERFSFRANGELRTGRWRVGQNLSLARFTRNNLAGFPLVDVARLQPLIPVYDPANASGYGYGRGKVSSSPLATFGTNPVGAFGRETNRDISNRALGNLFAEYSLGRGFRYRVNLGIDYEDLNWNNFVGKQQVRMNTEPSYNEGRDQRDTNMGLLMEHLMNYENTFGDHAVTAVAGITDQTNTFERLSAYGRNFPNEQLTQIDQATTDLDNTAYQVPSALRGLLVRANYSFADRYLLTGSFRRDGSSRFGSGNKYGDFFSGSAGWVLSEEPFFQGLPTGPLDHAKLRVSYGSLGNQDIGDFEYAASIAPGQTYVFGTTLATGATQVSLANPNLRWQDQTQLNVGLDLGFMDEALQLNADYYVSESDGILFNVPIPWSLGASGEPRVNAGSVRNRGFELGARWTIDRGDLQVTAAGNLTTIENEVTALGNGDQPFFVNFNGASVARTTVGGSIGEFYVFKTDGIFQNQAEIDAHVNAQGQRLQPSAKPGDIRYADVNGDGVFNTQDRYVAGDPVPDLETGLSLDATFRRFTFGLAMRGSFGAKVFNSARYWSERGDENSNYRADYNPWTPTNTNTDDPRVVFGVEGNDNARINSDRWLEDASFVRIQNVVVGYMLPTGLLNRVGVGVGQGTRVYLNVQNLHTFTGYSNWDPEVNSGNPLARGIDDARIYPNPRTVSLGVDLNL